MGEPVAFVTESTTVYVQCPAVSRPACRMDCGFTVKHPLDTEVSCTTSTQAGFDSSWPICWSLTNTRLMRCRTAAFAANVLHALSGGRAVGGTATVNIDVAELPAPTGVGP